MPEGSCRLPQTRRALPRRRETEAKEIITINDVKQPPAQRLTQQNQGHSEKTNLFCIVRPPETTTTRPWVRRN